MCCANFSREGSAIATVFACVENASAVNTEVGLGARGEWEQAEPLD